MRDLTSMQLSALMKAGVNVGNTFEAVIVGNDGSLSGDETCWGNPTPTVSKQRALMSCVYR